MSIARRVLAGDLLEVRRTGKAFQHFPAPAGSVAEPDLYVSAGFVEIQVNGFAGVDFNSPEATMADIERAIAAILATGVTRFLPTVVTGPRDDMIAALRNLARARRELREGQTIAGFHVEGPHISPEDGPRGAHPLESVRPPDIAEFRAWQEATGGEVRIVTLSPHWERAPWYIEQLVRAGTKVSIGHTHASSAQIADAVRAGATMSTHLGNGAHRVLPKFPNYVWDQLSDDRLSASFIADGIHLPDAFLRAAVRAKTVARSVLVTDASSPAGAVPGRYRLGKQAVDLTADGRVVLAGQDRLAGSALRMNDAIAHAVRVAGVSFQEAIRMATVNPATAAGLREDDSQVLFRYVDGRIEVLATLR
jgi:N-acetylglucosamine-6-phosphate deacetylase